MALSAAAAVGAGASAGAATPSCGGSCVDVFSRDFGTHVQPGFVMDVFRQGLKAGQPLILFRESNSDPAQDFTYSFQGNVSDLYAAGLVSPGVELHYGGGKFLPPPFTPSPSAVDEPAFEVEYAPYGVDSGLCVGVAAAAFQNEGVTLQSCGVSSRTVWIVDSYDKPDLFSTGYAPVINGSDANFSHPFVLTYPRGGYPADRPRPQLKVTNLTGFSSGSGPVTGTVASAQLWGADFGVLP